MSTEQGQLGVTDRRFLGGSYWARAVAYLIDFPLLYSFPLLAWEYTLNPLKNVLSDVPNPLAKLDTGEFLLWFAVWYSWLILFHVVAGRTGRTPGKVLLGLKLVDNETGEPIGFFLSAFREFIRIAQVMTVILGILDHLWPLWSKKGEALHDIWVGSAVIKPAKP